MAGFSVATNEHLIETDVWSAQLKTLLEDDLIAMKYVRMLNFDGDTIHIPSVGPAEVLDFDELQAVRYTSMDTGDFTFSPDQYKQSATYITQKMMQDSMYAPQLVSMFVPRQHRAIMTAIESRILDRMPLSQTASNLNEINGVPHRWVGGGTNETIVPEDFAKALYALQQADVPLTNLTAIVHPSVAFKLATMTNLTSLISPNPQWAPMVSKNFISGTRFVMNVYGFDVYVSNYLLTGLAETIDTVTTTSAAANLFFSAAPGDTMPLVFQMRQAPKVDTEFNKDLQRWEYVTTARYGAKVYRPENTIVVLTDTDQVF